MQNQAIRRYATLPTVKASFWGAYRQNPIVTAIIRKRDARNRTVFTSGFPSLEPELLESIANEKRMRETATMTLRIRNTIFYSTTFATIIVTSSCSFLLPL